MDDEIKLCAKKLIGEIREHLKTGHNKWSVERTYENLESLLNKSPPKINKVEEGWFRLLSVFLGIMTIVMGVSGMILQNQFSGLAFFFLAAATVMAGRKVSSFT